MNIEFINTIVSRWNDPASRPLFKGELINENNCMCAQGDILHHHCGWEFEDLRETSQHVVDAAVASALGISLTHSVLLRQINDKADGAPAVVLTNPGAILGDQHERVLKFWRHIDTLTRGDWLKIKIAVDAARAAAGAAAVDDAVDAARAAAVDAAGAAAVDAAVDAADAARAAADAAAVDSAWDAAWATNEIQGAEKLKSFFFLPMFGFATPADLDALP